MQASPFNIYCRVSSSPDSSSSPDIPSSTESSSSPDIPSSTESSSSTDSPVTTEGGTIVYNTFTQGMAVLDANLPYGASTSEQYGDALESRLYCDSENAGSSTSVSARNNTSTSSSAGRGNPRGNAWLQSIYDEMGAEGKRWLEKLGFIVPSASDQMEALSARYLADTTSEEALCLMVATTLDCNFKCPYCYEREVRHPGFMTRETEDAIVAFISRQVQEHGFKKVKIGWYGGEPLMNMGSIERITEAMEQLDVEYSASITSNLALANDQMIEKLLKCHLRSILTTLDGVGRIHDEHRPSVGGESTYDTIVHAIEELSSHGIKIMAVCNVDKTNIGSYRDLAKVFADNPMVGFSGSQLFDYCNVFGKVDDFRKPHYDIFDEPDTLAKMEYGRMHSEGMGSSEYSAMMRPIRLFCGRQLQSYCVIDEKGLIYECDGDIGYPDRVIGDVRTGINPPNSPYNPVEDPECENCEYLPVCLGNCRWTRNCCGMVCTPNKWIIDLVVNDWCKAIGDPQLELDGMKVLNPASPIDCSSPYELWG